MLDGSFIRATSVIHLITVVPACLFGLILVKVMINCCFHPSMSESVSLMGKTVFNFLQNDRIVQNTVTK